MVKLVASRVLIGLEIKSVGLRTEKKRRRREGLGTKTKYRIRGVTELGGGRFDQLFLSCEQYGRNGCAQESNKTLLNEECPSNIGHSALSDNS